MNVERGFRRIATVLSIGLFVLSTGFAALIAPDAVRRAGREAVRAILAARDEDFRDSQITTQDEVIEHVLREAPSQVESLPPGVTEPPVYRLKADARRAARAAQAGHWLLFGVAVGVSTSLPWTVFFVVRWVVRGFSRDAARPAE